MFVVIASLLSLRAACAILAARRIFHKIQTDPACSFFRLLIFFGLCRIPKLWWTIF